MFKAITSVLKSFSMLGVTMLIISLANIILGITYNITVLKKKFDIKKLLYGIFKVVVIYISTLLLATGATILPILLESLELKNLIKPEVLDVFSTTAIATLIITVTISQAANAISNLKKLSSSTTKTVV